MSSRKSSASYAKVVNTDTASNPDLVVFQGNRVTHPGRQPKLPPPVERQKDEGFARFLKKHSSPTHNRVTAGGRIVPMEPRSPPIFALDPNVTSRHQHVEEVQETRSAQRNGYRHQDRGLENQQPYENTGFAPVQAQQNTQTATARPMQDQGDMLAPVFFAQQTANNLGHAQMSTSYAAGPVLTPVRTFGPEQQMGGSVMPPAMQGQPMLYNPYHSPPVMIPAVPPNSDFGSSPGWPMFEQSFAPQDPAHHMLSAYQMLVAWEQHYHELDLQLKNIDRHRAMHQLDPYLAEQRRHIVQQRSDAKDLVREYSALFGVRRMIDSSQDSFATNFNVDAPAYVPAKFFDSTESMPNNHSSELFHNAADADKPKSNANRRAIPIVSPPDQNKSATLTQQELTHNLTTQGAADVDEWGIQNRSAPPEIHREQSRLSNILQAEQQRLSNSQDRTLQQPSRSQSSNQSQQGAPVDRVSDTVETEAGASDTKLQPAPENIPRDNEDETQQVMDAIGKPKGTTTQVRLLDNRVISVEGQGLDLSSLTPRREQGRNGSARPNARYLNQSQPQPGNSRDGRKRVTAAIPILSTDEAIGKENVLAAPRGHQKAATDAFLAQFNAVEDSTVLAVKPETRSLRTASNGLVEDRRYSGNHQSAAVNFPSSESITRKVNDLSLNAQQEMSSTPVIGQDSMSSQTSASVYTDDLLNKGYSLVSVQNVTALGRLPQNLDGTADARQIAQAHLAATEKARSPRLLRRHGMNGGAWYGPYCREVFDRARFPGSANRSAKTHAP